MEHPLRVAHSSAMPVFIKQALQHARRAVLEDQAQEISQTVPYAHHVRMLPLPVQRAPPAATPAFQVPPAQLPSAQHALIYQLVASTILPLQIKTTTPPQPLPLRLAQIHTHK